MAIDGDTALIGARFKTLGRAHRTGAAYLFARSGATWRRQATLHAFDPGSLDDFGHAVALSGDTALVGARTRPPPARAASGPRMSSSCPPRPSVDRSWRGEPCGDARGDLALSGAVRYTLAALAARVSRVASKRKNGPSAKPSQHYGRER